MFIGVLNKKSTLRKNFRSSSNFASLYITEAKSLRKKIDLKLFDVLYYLVFNRRKFFSYEYKISYKL
jgi:hypothetical protein